MRIKFRSTKIERSGISIPIGRDTKLQRMDIVTVVGVKDAVSRIGAFIRPGGTAEHGDGSPDAFRRHDPWVSHWSRPVPGLRRVYRAWQRRRPVGVWRDRLVIRVPATVFRQHAQRRAKHTRGSRSDRLRRDRRNQCRQFAVDTVDRGHSNQNLHRRFHRLLDPAGRRVGDRLPHIQDESRRC